MKGTEKRERESERERWEGRESGPQVPAGSDRWIAEVQRYYAGDHGWYIAAVEVEEVSSAMP